MDIDDLDGVKAERGKSDRRIDLNGWQTVTRDVK
jgi:hypothetical protein